MDASQASKYKYQSQAGCELLLNRLSMFPGSNLSVSFANFIIERYLNPAIGYSDSFDPNQRSCQASFLTISEENRSGFILLKFLSKPAYSLPFLDASEQDSRLAKTLIAGSKDYADQLWILAHSRNQQQVAAFFSDIQDQLKLTFDKIYKKPLSQITNQDINRSRWAVRSQIVEQIPDRIVQTLENFIERRLATGEDFKDHYQKHKNIYEHSREVLFLPNRNCVYRDFRLAMITELYSAFDYIGSMDLLDAAKLLRHVADHKRAACIESLCLETLSRSSELRRFIDNVYSAKGRRILAPLPE